MNKIYMVKKDSMTFIVDAQDADDPDHLGEVRCFAWGPLTMPEEGKAVHLENIDLDKPHQLFYVPRIGFKTAMINRLGYPYTYGPKCYGWRSVDKDINKAIKFEYEPMRPTHDIHGHPILYTEYSDDIIIIE